MRNLEEMKKNAIIVLFLTVALPLGIWNSPVVQAQEEVSLEDLKERVETLEMMIQPPEITGADRLPAARPLLFETLREKKFLEGIEIIPGVALSGLLEVEANYEVLDRDEGASKRTSDLNLATLELGVDIDVIKYLHGHFLLLWEEDAGEPVDLDEGIITLGAEEDFPYFLSVGRMYLPFGVFESHFISDPLTLELGEIRETALLLGMEHDLFTAAVGAYRGGIGKTGEAARIDNLVAALNFTPVEGLVAGVSYLNNIADTDGLADFFPEGEVNDYVGGISAYFNLAAGPLTLSGEYLGALEKFQDIPAPEGSDLEGREPKTWNLEVAYIFPDEAWEAAWRYEGTSDFPGFPTGQGGICLSWGLLPNTTVAAEYLYAEYKNDDRRHLVTGQLAFEF
jgi:hypothetical protein